MNNFRIFTESKTDVKFLKDYIADVFNKELQNIDFDMLGSWSGYKIGGTLTNSIKENSVDNSKLSILILDADTDFTARLHEIENDFIQYKVSVKIFLFPNHANNGNIETLLAEIAVNKELMECFHSYEKCIEGYEKPVSKSKIFAYLDALLPQKNKKNNKEDLIQDANRNYKNKEHWDLNHNYLNPLKDFLSQHLNL
ncbi:MAG TPA: DUF3226 domain-containing protein [Chitinophagaceae bacterium]|nr:DUF3226 domain-containing protein [Chitinophagaceae bacterium]